MKWKPSAAPLVILLAVGAGFTIISYNTWSFCCGRCSAADLMDPGPAGFSLLALTFFFAIVLILLRRSRRRTEAHRRCRCGQFLAGSWLYCARCGIRLPV